MKRVWPKLWPKLALFALAAMAIHIIAATFVTDVGGTKTIGMTIAAGVNDTLQARDLAPLGWSQITRVGWSSGGEAAADSLFFVDKSGRASGFAIPPSHDGVWEMELIRVLDRMNPNHRGGVDTSLVGTNDWLVIYQNASGSATDYFWVGGG